MSTDDTPASFHANADQARYWDEEAGPKWVRHEASMNARMRALTEELMRRIDAQPGERILDIGCGGGATAELLARAVGRAGRVHGIDISKTMLGAARARCRDDPQVSFEYADAQVHPFTPRSFDRLASRFGVMFFSDPYAAFENLAGALGRGGRLAFACWAPVDLNPWFTVPLGVAKRHLGAPEPTPPRAPGPLAFSDRDYVGDILARAGFRDIEIDTVETAMSSRDTPEEQADLFLRIGPAARLVADRQPDADTLRALAEDLVRELREHEADGAIALGATVHYVRAGR